MPLDIGPALYDYPTQGNQPGEGPEIYQGATYRRIYLIQDASGAAVDLTGYSGTCEFDDESGTQVFVATVSITNAAAGEVTVEIPVATTTGVTPVVGTSTGTICAPADFEFFTSPTEFQLLNFDLFLNDGAGVVQNVVKGKARFFPSTNV